jgi:hypothetical protein
MDAVDQAPRISGGPSGRSARLAAAAKAGAAAAVLGTLDRDPRAQLQDLAAELERRAAPAAHPVHFERRRPRA